MHFLRIRVGVIATPATIRSHAYFSAIKDENPAVEVYEPGSWGPESASHLLTGHGGWRKPWLPE